MSAALDGGARLLVLAVPAFVGALCGVLQLFRDPRAAVTVLNRYALTIGFPALVTRGLLEASSSIPTAPAFWILWPGTLSVVLLVVRLLQPGPSKFRMRAATGAVTTFGNVAYLGLPFALATLGPSIAGPAVFAVSVHVTGAVTVGPWLLARASEGAERATSRQLVGRIAKLPLFWAPWIGLLGRMLPESVRGGVSVALDPIAASAAPVALFLLGLHLYVERGRLRDSQRDVAGLVGARMILSPMIMLAMSWGAVTLGWLSPELGVLHVVLASMPVAIATFSMAHEAGVLADRVASSIAVSSLLALIALPVWLTLARAVLGA